jgi:outer membrane receptor protein involved in Fe transport
MYGRAFRNPSTFERYYEPNLSLEAERIQSVEVSRQQQFKKRVTLLTSIFHYRLTGLIEGVAVGENRLQYQNSSQASATGVELELNGHPFEWLDTTMSYTVNRVRGADNETRLENSPAQIAHLRAAVPFARSKMVLAGAMHYIGSRRTVFDGSVPAATLFDLTGTAKIGNRGMDLQFGVRNLFDQQYSDPLSTEHLSATLPRAGRSVYVKLTWHED